MENNDHIR